MMDPSWYIASLGGTRPMCWWQTKSIVNDDNHILLEFHNESDNQRSTLNNCQYLSNEDRYVGSQIILMKENKFIFCSMSISSSNNSVSSLYFRRFGMKSFSRYIYRKFLHPSHCFNAQLVHSTLIGCRY